VPYKGSDDNQVQVQVMSDDEELTREVSAGDETGGSWEMESRGTRDL